MTWEEISKELFEKRTAKRFTIVDEQFISYYGGTGYLISNGECKIWLWHRKEESQKVCNKLNSILDENEQLKKDIENYKTERLALLESINKKYDLKMTENKRYKNVAKDDSVVIQDNMLHCVFVDCDDIVEVLNEKEALMLHYEKRLSELQMEIDKLSVMKSKGLKVLEFYEHKLKNADKKEFKNAREELWIVKEVLCEIGVIKDDD